MKRNKISTMKKVNILDANRKELEKNPTKLIKLTINIRQMHAISITS